MKALFLITGERGAGMTNLCVRAAQVLKEQGRTVAGIACPIVFYEGRRIQIAALNVQTGERRILANSRMFPEVVEDSDITTNSWTFIPGTIQWGNEIYRTAEPVDLLVVDELGELEFEFQTGWMDALQAVDQREYQVALVVTRPRYLPAAQERWPDAEVVHLDRRDSNQILELIERLQNLFNE